MQLISAAIRCLVSLTLISCAVAMARTEKQKPTPSPVPSPMPSQKTMETKTPAANPADVASIDAIIAAVYDVISGPAGKKRDWDRMRSLFVPGARLIPTAKPVTSDQGRVTSSSNLEPHVLDIDGYIVRVEPFFAKSGFYEKE